MMAKLYMIVAAASLVGALGLGWWVSSLLSDIDTLETQNKALQVSVEARDAFITAYEKARKTNEAETARLIDLTRNIQNDPVCPAPADFRAVIDSL